MISGGQCRKLRLERLRPEELMGPRVTVSTSSAMAAIVDEVEVDGANI